MNEKKKQGMNLPNKLTVFRVILILPFVVMLLGSDQKWGWYEALFGGLGNGAEWVALAIFVVASLTDMLDGKIARKYNLVTNFGKFMDPLADKLLVCAAMIVLVDMARIPSWIVIIIISREFIVYRMTLILVWMSGGIDTLDFLQQGFIRYKCMGIFKGSI